MIFEIGIREKEIAKAEKICTPKRKRGDWIHLFEPSTYSG
jgi:hypothetical protein